MNNGQPPPNGWGLFDKYPSLRWLAMFCFLTLLIIVVMAVLQGREVSLWPPRIGAIPTSNIPAMDTTVGKAASPETVLLPSSTTVPPQIPPSPFAQTVQEHSAPTPTTNSESFTSCTATPHLGLQQSNHFFSGAIHIAELWRSNRQTPWSDKLMRAVVYGDINVIEAGGSIWTYPAGCDAAVQAEVTNNPAAMVISEQQMRDAGIIK